MTDSSERGRLLTAWAGAVDSAASQRRGSILSLCGEAGIGKTTMVNTLIRRVRPTREAWCGYCEDLLSPRPLGPLHDMAQFPQHPLAGLLARRDWSSTELFPAIASLLEQGTAGLVVFEDVHWADEATIDLMLHLGRRIVRLPLLLVLTHRDEEVDACHPLRALLGMLPAQHLRHVKLGPLSQEDVASLARQHGQSPEALFRTTAGNPFYLTELLASLAGQAPSALPSTVRATVQSRLARLPAPERDALHALCVEPGRIELWVAERVLGARWAELVDGCAARGLLTAQDQVLLFRHELARRATLDALAPMLRRALHARMLAALSAPPAGQAAPSPARLVHHAAEAGDGERVLALAPAAAAQAAALGAHREAARHYAVALRFADSAEPDIRAQLNESWSYEAGLSTSIDQETIAARHRAIALWRAVGRRDKVGLNLRWLSRLHWYCGEKQQADRYVDEAVQVLASEPDSAELAMACSVRSQMYMLADQTDAAIDWGQRAIALAQRLGATEALVHALNNVGTAELFADRPGGLEKLERSLALALEHGMHEHAARVYTNVSEYGVVFRDHALAERFLGAGLAFDRRHDLDAWTHYLEGWLARLRLEQGRHDEAEQVVRDVLALPHLTLVMRLPALCVLAQLQVRAGADTAASTLQRVLGQAEATGEPQRIVPLVTLAAEAAWLHGDLAGCRAALRRVDGMALGSINRWEMGALAVWQRRAGVPEVPGASFAPPHALELAGDPEGAAAAWLRIGAPYDAGLAYLQVEGERRGAAWAEAVRLFDQIGARAAAQHARRQARRAGVAGCMPHHKRGPYREARRHPRGLTAREQEVLTLLAQGLSNAQIAGRLMLAERTVEHHVSAVIAKLGAADRHAAVHCARSEQLLGMVSS